MTADTGAVRSEGRARGPVLRGTAAAEEVGARTIELLLGAGIQGEVRTDPATRGRYASDASIYQIMPEAVVFPKTADDVAATLLFATREGLPVIARGAGTSQNGQPIGRGLVLDFSRHMGAVLDIDADAGTAAVQPGCVLDALNGRLRPQGWFFPVEPSTASRCTLGGMAGNNSCGARSIRYGKMVDNVLAVEGLLADGSAFAYARGGAGGTDRARALAAAAADVARRERPEIEARFPKVQRRVGGYNLDELAGDAPNPAGLLVGSEGTLALTTGLSLRLSRLPAHRAMGVCHFPSFRAAMETTRHLVALGPVAVELVDNNVLVLGADIPLFRRTLADITKGAPDCLLLVEFAGDALGPLRDDLRRLAGCMADHGYPDAVVEVLEPARQRQVWEMREACLNIMMSMKGDGKPVSFIEDCAVPLEHLADYTDAVTELFARHGTRGTWYAHASVGCLHVRPILNMKDGRDVAAMRAIAEAACDLVARFSGSHSGEHGDGISRSEFHERMFGARLVRAFEEVKDAFDPQGLLNPGKIVRPYRMDDRSLLRFPEGYGTEVPGGEALDWSGHGGFAAAVEMCNNNGTCRKLAGGAMCPSYRVTRDEQHLTRGRANTLRLALSGALGADALSSPDVTAAMDLCVGCKACRRECPTGVDMARMKIEVAHHRNRAHGPSLHDRLVGHLPRYAPLAAAVPALANLRDRVPALARLSERAAGLSARRRLPVWRRPWREGPASRPDAVEGDGRDAVLLADTFNRYFEPENLEAAVRVLRAAGYRVHAARAPGGGRPLCCGRTYLASGMVDEARAEARRTAEALAPFVARGARVAGIEPSCLFTLKDEFAALLPADLAGPVGAAAMLVDELLADGLASGLARLPLADRGPRTAHLHGHCHQKAFGATTATEAVLGAVPGLSVRPVESSCCGMAGAFGYRADKVDVSLAMAELSLFPALRAAAPDDLVVADGTSCRHQIRDGLGREAVHAVRVLDDALAPAAV
jgi:FAD/FMN-containing dehydrogenase/Fe-S oxidoreductase